MATPQPTDGDVDRSVPHGEEAVLIVRGLASAPRQTNGLTGLQATLFRAIVHAMLGLDVDVHALEPVEPDEFAGALAREAEIEAFGFIALASDDPDAFALPAMVINLFETDAVMGSTGISDVAARHLSRPGMPARLATHFAAARLSRRQRLLRVRLVRTDGAGPRRAAPRTWPTANVTGSDCGRQRPALASRRHEPRPAGRGSEREGSNWHHVTRASEAGMTAKSCDPTTTAQEEGR